MSNEKLSGNRNTLEISHRGKSIASGGFGTKRLDGSANYGFKNLKGIPKLLDNVPELQRDPALRSLVAAINTPETSFFSVGCLSDLVEDEHGFRVTGYIEFALNSQSAVVDAASYFPAFYHFDRMLYDESFPDRVLFSWELCPAHFGDANCDGFTVAVTVNTDYHGSKSEAWQCWQHALAVLERFLPAVSVRRDDPIYEADTAGRS